jgi:thioredoxin-related protein
MKSLNPIFIITILFLITVSFVPKKDKVQWLTIEELHDAYLKNPKPILVDVYTSWCGWCKVMDKETYNNEKVADYINEHYYAVKLDAELKDSLEWNGKKYGYNKEEDVNELASYFTYGQMSFPSTVFLTDLNAQPEPLSGYLKVKEIETPLKFFGEGAYKNQNLPDFDKTFITSW